MPIHDILILSSAYKHGISKKEILNIWCNPLWQATERQHPLKVTRLGYGNNSQMIEVCGEILTNGQEKIFHAMPARKKYLHLLGQRP